MKNRQCARCGRRLTRGRAYRKAHGMLTGRFYILCSKKDKCGCGLDLGG